MYIFVWHKFSYVKDVSIPPIEVRCYCHKHIL